MTVTNLNIEQRYFQPVIDVIEERERQEEKFGEQTVAHPDAMTDMARMMVIQEQLHQAENVVQYIRLGRKGSGDTQLRDELVRLAANALAFIECIDARLGGR